MKMKHVLAAGFGALALGLVATGAEAAPMAVLGSAVDATADAGVVQKAHWWGHRRHYGHYHGYYRPYYRHYGYYDYYRPYYRYRWYKPYRWHKPYGYGYHRHWH